MKINVSEIKTIKLSREEYRMQKYGKGTQAVQGGYRPENAQPRQVPIVQSTTFKFDNSEFMENYLISNNPVISIQD